MRGGSWDGGESGTILTNISGKVCIVRVHAVALKFMRSCFLLFSCSARAVLFQISLE